MNGPVTAHRKKKPLLLRIFVWTLSIIVFLVLTVFTAFKVSPWPSALLIRHSFQKGGVAMNDSLAKYVPPGVASKLDIKYDGSDGDALLDIYYPNDASTGKRYPLIIWVHGGAFIAGDKSELANYCKILASKGFVVAPVNYSLAPGKNFPLPVSQLNTAIAFLLGRANDFFIDASGVYIAGDSGGSQISAALANVFSSKEYADLLGIRPSVEPGLLKGVILHCGPFNTALVDFNSEYGSFLRTAMWSYIGKKDFINDPMFIPFSVTNFVTEKFPRTFISVGNKDPLRPHSYELASKLSAKGVKVDSLFFPDDYAPGLQHEYQFNLDTDAGKLALERTVKFLTSKE